MFNRSTINLQTYTLWVTSSGSGAAPNSALINVTNVISYIAPWSTKFSIMTGQTYNSISSMTSDEVKAMNSGWYATIAFRS